MNVDEVRLEILTHMEEIGEWFRERDTYAYANIAGVEVESGTSGMRGTREATTRSRR